jgi:hypothetical protein
MQLLIAAGDSPAAAVQAETMAIVSACCIGVVSTGLYFNW